MSRVLITGGAGFIGHHLARHMLTRGWSVAVIDNEATGRREDVPPSCDYLKGDVRNVADVREAFATQPDVVFHCAAQASNIRSFDDPLADLNTNLLGTVNVTLQCIEQKVPKLVYAGSMTEYGVLSALPVGEAHPLVPISYYGVGKAAAEHFLMATANRVDLGAKFSVTVPRMFNVYGPGQSLTNPYQGVLAIFIGQVLRGEPCTVDGDGTQSRDFVYVDDVCEAWERMSRPGVADNTAVNLGSGVERSVNDLVREVCLAAGKDPAVYPIMRRPRRPGDQERCAADIARAKERLGWAPAVTFAEGLARTMAWARASGGGV
ncbi:GDP-mannose 4,6-dehydratase [bacterium]|nr:GDP-mannose 4,6-dehydratase [bacterium]